MTHTHTNNYVFSIAQPTWGKILSRDMTGTMKTSVQRAIRQERPLLKDRVLVEVLIFIRDSRKLPEAACKTRTAHLRKKERKPNNCKL